MFKVKFHIVFSERIDFGNARMVFIFPNCSSDRVRYAQIFLVYRIVSCHQTQSHSSLDSLDSLKEFFISVVSK